MLGMRVLLNSGHLKESVVSSSILAFALSAERIYLTSS